MCRCCDFRISAPQKVLLIIFDYAYEVVSPLAVLLCCHGDSVRTVVLNEGSAAIMIMVVIAIHRTGMEYNN